MKSLYIWGYGKKSLIINNLQDMKRQCNLLSFAILLIVSLSCSNNNNEWTENQKRAYFEDSIAFRLYNSKDGKTLNNFVFFMDSLYPENNAINKHCPYVYAFEEPYFDPNNFDNTINLIRIIMVSCWDIPMCVTLEKKNNKTILTSKITNGDGGYYCGTLLSSFMKIYPDTLYDFIYNEFVELNYWNLDSAYVDCSDGEEWHFEIAHEGRYHYLYRHCLFGLKDTTNKKLLNIGLEILTLGKYFDLTLYSKPWLCSELNTFIKLVVDSNDFKRKLIGAN